MVLATPVRRAPRALRGTGAAALGLIAVYTLATTLGPTSDASINDLPIYSAYSGGILHGLAPYRDFLVEYPPLSLAPMLAGRAAGGGRHAYEWVFGALMGVSLLGLLAAVAGLARERAAQAAWAVALSPLLTGALVRTHFDALVVALMAAGLLAVARRRPVLGLAILGVATMVKWFPAVLVPVVLAWLLAQGRQREALRGAIAFAAVVVLVSAPFAGHGYLDSYRFHLDRPVQIESTPATVLFALGGSHSTGPFTRHPDRFRSQGLAGPDAGTVESLFAVLLLAALAVVVAAAYGCPDEEQLLLCAMAAVLAFVALNKVASPQYMVWLVPVFALAWAGRERVIAVLTAAAMVLTQFEFPPRYFDLVHQHTGVIVLVAARNAVLLLALGVAMSRLASRAGTARSSPPAAAETPL
jgi:uncharacterized membrane protein